ncbi:TPA: fimbrial biogenesis outer membrane usher protein [Salmonella enterica subsp. enterica serovar Aberdeen]|uniref:Fimbrial biogenesis outer membrane usher protein n=1 Tax=Salmonella enterica TaxID=28901 RepID=A0A5T3M7G1_SALER|nr:MULTISPECIES: fimbrial biogenesis outer membrane usher protein [Salmonella]EAA8420044.1 fimbrial biogenesis outer membrane usher protein [Salmonella enterica subsp. enterica]EAB5697459.1 fimbrial biogenesis outer membrane usher protein [Salmonella enterica subsp. enterica serovar Aberdeen]ECO1503033.1 fimbrial biogenesis outer membrane usher protein [Salmonella enterica subsp. enterica serovar Virchow]EAA2244155.1 fimbrial biogenesis outer membrane usher protein [Salmonella enterica subsp. e
MKYLKLPLYIKTALYCSLATTAFSALAEELNFDMGILTSRGISPNVAQYFSRAPRFLPGSHTVMVKINGVNRGSLVARFDTEGQLCVDDDFLSASGLVPLNISAKETCHSLQEDYPSAIITPLPNSESLELFVPAQALDNNLLSLNNVIKGGTAGLFNYNLYASRSESSGSDSRNYAQANLEAGLNFAEWTLRSRYMLTNNDGEYRTDSLYTYAEHVFQAQKMRAQVGQINVNSSLFSGAPINGVQLIPEQGLAQDTQGVTINGIARTHQARVEVRQSGQIIYTAPVNAGAFTLENVPIIRSNTDLNVSVVETDGSTTTFTVPAVSFNLRELTPAGLTMSIGRIRDTTSDYSLPWIYNISDSWKLSENWLAQASGVLAQDYQAAGGMLQWLPTNKWTFSGSMLGSKASFGESLQGAKSELRASMALPGEIRLDVSTARYSDGYRELTDALNKDAYEYQSSSSANIAWNHNLLGTFSLGYYTYQATDNDNDSRSIMASWGKTFKYASITANWQHAVNQDDENHNDSNDDDMFYINISIPLGEQRVGAYMRNQGDKTTYGLQNNGSLSKDTHYYISADRDAKNQQNSFNGNLNSNLHYTQLSVGGGTDGDNYRNYNATFSGGIAAHEHGITFSPYTIKNTFAIARLSEPESGIEIATPQGRIWTDHWGQAVIPGLTEWRKSRVEVNANTLPKSMELANGIKNITVAHSAFRVLDFNVLNTRRVMLTVKRPDGSWLPKGTSIVDEKNNYLVSAVDSGRVFITDVGDNPALYAADDDMNRLCRIHYTLQKTQDKEAFYETAKGVCQ